MVKFWEKFFNNKGKDRPPAEGANGNTLNLFQTSGSNPASPPISLPRSKGGPNGFPADYYPYEDDDDDMDLNLDIPATLRPQVSRDDFEPLGILGRGSFATVILVRSKLQGVLMAAVAAVAAASNNSAPGSLKRPQTLGASPTAGTPSRLTSSGPVSLGAGPSSLTTSSSGPVGFGSNKDLYAMKIIAKKRLLDSKRMTDVFTERDVLTKSSHPYLLRLHYTFQSEHKLFFVMDYMPGGDIRQLINGFRRRREPMPYDMARLFAAEVTLALTHLHDHGILYRDLKPENILLSAEGHCALADFGLSKDFGDIWMDEDDEIAKLKGKMSSMRATSFVGSPLYVAPEVLLREKYSKPIDFWGLGILIFTLLFGAEPFRGSNSKEIFDKILANDVRFPTSMTTTPEAMDIIVRLLAKNPAQRLGAPDIFAHPFFRGIDWSALMRQELTPEGWVVPPPPQIISPDGSPQQQQHDGQNHLAPPAQASGAAPGQPLQPTTRGRGFSEIYTPDHHTGQLRGSQQCFFENFSWTNVEHLYAISGEAQIVLTDGTVIHASGQPMSDDSSSDFYDAPLPDTPNEFQRSFNDLPDSAITLTGHSGRRSSREQSHGGGHSKRGFTTSQGGNSGRFDSGRFDSGRFNNVIGATISPPNKANNTRMAQPLPRPTVNTAASAAPPVGYRNLQHAQMADECNAGFRQPGAGSAVGTPLTNAQFPPSSPKQTMGKAQSSGSFFAPPPSDGFDSNLSL